MICQVVVFVLGVACIWMISLNNKWSKYGMIVGFVAQPFWLLTSWRSESWGVFALAAVYLGIYANGIKNWFWKKKRKTK
jgi:hypothetical protein